MNLKDLKIITGWDDGNNIVVIHKVNDVRKRMIIKNFQWYFVIQYVEYERLGHAFFEYFFKNGIITKLVKNHGNLKIYANRIFKGNITLFTLIDHLKQKNVQVYESDLSLLKRFLIDNDISVEENLSVLYFDIETDDRNNGIEIGRDTILSWAAYDSKGNVWFESGDEKEILTKFIKLINSFDVISGWNSDQFDLPYIKERLNRHEIVYDWRKVIHVDLMSRCVKLYSYDMDKIGLKGFSLNEISRVFLKQEKVKFDGGIYELYKNDFEKFKEYNIQDVSLLYQLDQKLDIIRLMIKECAWTGTLLNRFYIGELLDNYIIKEAKKKNIYMHSRPSKYEIEELDKIKIIGGYVKEPTTGLYSNVRVLDYKSLYPSIIVGWNIGEDSLNRSLSEHGDISFNNFVGPDRKIEDINITEWHNFLAVEKKKLDPNDEHYQTANNNFFRKDISSFISKLVKHLLDLRKEYKKKLSTVEVGSAEYGTAKAMQAVVKEMANSMYGITADKKSRYFDKHIAEGITLTGQFLNKVSSNILEKNGYPVIYGDSVIGSTEIRYKDLKYSCTALWNKFEYAKKQIHGKEVIVFSELTNNPTTYSMSTQVYKKNTRNFEKKMKISKMIRHWTKKKLYQITTESGKSVIVTKDHSIVVHRKHHDVVLTPENIDISNDLIYVKSTRKHTTPSTAFKRGQKDWSNGLTKETNKSVRTRGRNVSKSLIKYYNKNIKARQRVRECRLKQKFGKKETKLEIFFERILKKLKIQYDKQKAIERYCTPDFIINSKKIAIFCDGDYWHANPKFYHVLNVTQSHNILVDKRQRKMLIKKGWKIIRFFENDIYNNTQLVINKLKKHVT